MAELKPCPFCGCANVHVGTVAEHEMLDSDSLNYSQLSKSYDVVCNYNAGGCGASTGSQYTTKEQAIKAWNRRVNDES